jgi:DeoR/GlpR family transcriptional regulator of sugar metabolism
MSSVSDEIHEMLNELENESLPLLDEENDLTISKIMVHFKTSETTARRKAKQMVSSGKWEAVYKRTLAGNETVTYKRKE